MEVMALYVFFLVVGLGLGYAMGKVHQQISSNADMHRLQNALQRRDEELNFLGVDTSKL